MTATTQWKRAILLPVCGLLLTAAGCFRPAGETVEDSIGGVVDPAASASVGQDVEPTPADVNDGIDAATATPGLLLEAASTLPSGQVDSRPTSSLPITLIPLGSAAETPTSAPIVVTLANVTTAPAFITPGAPLAPITLEPGTPFPGPSGQIEVLPTQGGSGLITPTSLPGTGDDCLYIVQPGDSLYQISLNEDVTLDDLRAVNPELAGENPLLQIGQQITLPGCGDGGLTTDAAVDAPTPTPTPAEGLLSATGTEAEGEEYVVQRGDTLYGIALRFGVTVQAIINANVDRLADPNRLQIGDRLIIPNAGD